MSFLGWLQLLLIALKIMGYLTVSWWIVLIPIIISIIIMIILTVIFLVVFLKENKYG